MTNLYFVRHAHSIYTPNELERPLSTQGLAGAEKVTKILKGKNINRVISSPYKRALQTVEGIANFIGGKVEIMESFKERTLSEKPVKDFKLAITKVWEDDSFSWEGGETNLHAQGRGVKAVHDVLEKYDGENIVIGTHGNIMVLIMNYFNKQYDFRFWQELTMPDIYKLTFYENRLVNVNRIWDA